MAYPHAIRLRGPWEYQPLARLVRRPDGSVVEETDGLPTAGRVELPSDWDSTLGSAFHGRILLRRRFGIPGQLDPHERVWLTVDLPGVRPIFRFNGRELSLSPGIHLYHQFDLTGLLQNRNELELEISNEPPEIRGQRSEVRDRQEKQTGNFPDVRLEVRASHFVDRLGVEICASESACHVYLSGHIVGAAADDLALVATLGRRELAYQQLQSNTSFSLTATADEVPSWLDAQARRNPAQFELKLLRGAVRLWEGKRSLLKRRVQSTPGQSTLSVDGQSFPLSTAESLSSDWARRITALTSDRLFQTASVLRDDDYDQLDRLGLKLIQHVPADWAAELVPRLSHHPSVVAWTAAGSEVESLAARYAAPCAGARPWIPFSTH